jgi:predicted secreted protein with PEFG-CTERM motif
MISGQVRDLLSGTPVSLQVFAANGNLVTIEQIDISPDKTFSTEISAGGVLWKSKGTYTVKVLYGTQSRTAETAFEFGGSSGTTPKPTGTIGVDRTNFVLSYKITGGSVLSVTPDDEANSLVIAIKTTSDGVLTITLPRALIDAKINEQDDNFFVLIDGEEVEFEETTTDTDRTLTINFPDGAEEIEIIGSFVVPEFGTIAALILAIAIISIIAVSAKTRLSILPKY